LSRHHAHAAAVFQGVAAAMPPQTLQQYAVIRRTDIGVLGQSV